MMGLSILKNQNYQGYSSLFYAGTVQEHYATSNEMNLAPTVCCDLVGSRNVVTDSAERMESTNMSGVARAGPAQPMQAKGIEI